MSFIATMLSEIGNNWYIFAFAAIDMVVGIISYACSKKVEKHFEQGNSVGLKKWIYNLLNITYSFFLTIISMFPLLGMLGTVISLIGLGNVFENSGGDINGIQANFFLALTSTAWGILFSVLFKLINAGIQPNIEDQLEKAKKSLNM